MAEAGYQYANQEAAYSDFVARGREFMSGLVAGYATYPVELALGISQTAGEDLDAMPWFDGHELEHLLEDEVAVATADHECHESEVEEALEQRLAKNRADLVSEYSSTISSVLSLEAE